MSIPDGKDDADCGQGLIVGSVVQRQDDWVEFTALGVVYCLVPLAGADEGKSIVHVRWMNTGRVSWYLSTEVVMVIR